MGVSIMAFEVSSGHKLTPLPVSGGKWSVTTNADDVVSATLPINTAEARKLMLYPSTELKRVGLLAVDNGRPVAAGPILKRGFAKGEVSVTAGGLRAYLASRYVLPIEARTTSLVDGNGDPRTSLDTVTSGLSLGSIGRRYVELVSEWPGTPPIALPPVEAGTHERTVKAVDLDDPASLIAALSNVEGGPDFAFEPRWSEDGLGIFWQMVHGSTATPRLGNTDARLVQWSVNAGKGTAFDLEIDEEAGNMASEAWAVGGGSADKVLAARAFDSTLLDAGYPLMQTSDTGLDNVTAQATVAARARQLVNLGKTPAAFWSMSVRRGDRRSVQLGDFWLGDMATIVVGTEEHFPLPGYYERRIAKIEGEVGKDYHRITFAEALA